MNPGGRVDIKDAVKEKYAEAALRAAAGEKGSCGPSGACGCDPVTQNLYDISQTTGLPEAAVLASLGCGNPTALAELHAGEVVLDLGSGGGIDVLLSAKRVGPTGKAYGLDMTDEMLALARANQANAGATNVEGYRMSRPYTNGYFDGYAFDRDIVYEGEIRDYSEGPSKILRPFFDWVWAKCGLVRPDVESLA